MNLLLIIECLGSSSVPKLFNVGSIDIRTYSERMMNRTRFYQMDVKSAFLYGKIDKEVYVSQPSGFIDPKFSNKVYKVVKAVYGSHQAPKAWYATLSTFVVQSGYERGLIGKTLFIKKDKKDIMLTKKPLVKDEEAADVDVHLYRSMIGSLMYLTASRPDIMYAVCACSRESAFDLEAYSDSDYAGANHDRKSTTGGCQFLGRRLISWQCKKKTIVATSTTEAEKRSVFVGQKYVYLDTYHKTNEEPVDQEDQVFLEELERLKRHEKEANDAAATLRKTFVQSTEDLLLQAGVD
nr:hypothetical protein [Tanacetum cinerariifolium]